MMSAAQAGARIELRNILFLTDFSEPSEAALPYAVSIAREYGCVIHALHVLTPAAYIYTAPELTADAIAAQEECAERDMARLTAQLTGVPNEAIILRNAQIWPSLEQVLRQRPIDLIVLGTHGRTGAQKLLLGSVAEEIFRRSKVPVLTIGPWARKGLHNAARFQRVLFATDFTPESLAAVPYAVSFAQENQARLVLLYVMNNLVAPTERPSVADVMHRLSTIVPKDAELWCKPEASVEYGDVAQRILSAAEERGADLIVMGVRSAVGHLGAATHLERSVAHQIVAHARCPVLTVRD
jgi:nucleotide-binding universal stress UspA family protein